MAEKVRVYSSHAINMEKTDWIKKFYSFIQKKRAYVRSEDQVDVKKTGNCR
jgi:hypothetical protein